MISKRLYILLCDYVDCPLSETEMVVLGESTDEKGRNINPNKYANGMKKAGLHMTKFQKEIINMLCDIERIRRFNKRGY